MEKETKTMFSNLADVNVNEHIDKKKTGSTELSYLSWAWAWKYFKEAIRSLPFSFVSNSYAKSSHNKTKREDLCNEKGKHLTKKRI